MFRFVYRAIFRLVFRAVCKIRKISHLNIILIIYIYNIELPRTF